MSTLVATVFYGSVILGLFILNRDRKSRVSKALWIPVVWVSICASRFVSQWLAGAATSVGTVSQMADGNPFDAAIFAALLAAGLLVLSSRGKLARSFLRANGPLILFFAYCAISAMWSDYPLVSIKRWIKAVGDLVMVLVVLSDPEPVEALKRLFARVGFVLVPLSILLIKYYPTVGREYSGWTGEAYNIGVSTGKNGLGYACLLSGIGALWCLIQELSVKGRPRRTGPLLAYSMLLVLVFWLFWMAHSATSLCCFLIGGGFMVISSLRSLRRTPRMVYVFLAVVLFTAWYGLVFNPGIGLAETVGRDSTLTGRTEIWHQALSLATNPLFGAGYESFWLGSRLERMWAINWWHPIQAHNGYLEIYLDLGLVGVIILAFLLFWGCRSVVKTFRRNPEIGSLKIALFVIAMIYNLTEHAFRELHPVWIMMLLAITAMPQISRPPQISRQGKA
jgi:exopolysaccharide production protein ExoQ